MLRGMHADAGHPPGPPRPEPAPLLLARGLLLGLLAAAAERLGDALGQCLLQLLQLLGGPVDDLLVARELGRGVSSSILPCFACAARGEPLNSTLLCLQVSTVCRGCRLARTGRRQLGLAARATA